MAFQAAVTALAAVAIGRGQRLDWLEDRDDTPINLWVETHGPGDDLRVRLTSGEVIEAQVKKGLQTGPVLWEAMMALARGVAQGTINYGVLVVDGRAGGPISVDLAEDLKRLADGRSDDLTSNGAAFVALLKAEALNVRTVCAGLRIQTINAGPGQRTDIRNAKAHLESLVREASKSSAAWEALVQESRHLIARRGALDAASIGQVLRGAGLELAQDPSTMPSVEVDRLGLWTRTVNATFAVIGARRPLSVRSAWGELDAVLLDMDQDDPANLAEALDRYHKGAGRKVRDARIVDASTVGRFYRQSVVIAGPGMGKTTLLKRLALSYAADGAPVLRTSLRSVATRMQRSGEAFSEAVFQCGLADSPMSPAFGRTCVSGWTLLLDGLDECGPMQGPVIEGLAAYAQAHPEARIVATSRPIGYRAASLRGWRHYELDKPSSTWASIRVSQLLEEILQPQDALREQNLYDLAERQLSVGRTEALATSSPLLLGLSASLIARRIDLGASKPALYQVIIKLIEEEPQDRTPPMTASASLRARFLEILAWRLAHSPLLTFGEVHSACAETIAAETGRLPLSAREAVDACLDHWIALGVVERVSHAGSEALTFVHKTFGEYLAARYLSALPSLERRSMIEATLEVANWSEIHDFAAAMGCADELVNALLMTAGDQRPRALRRALLLASEPDVDLSAPVLDQLLNVAFDNLTSSVRYQVLKAAQGLSKLVLRFPRQIGVRASSLLDHERTTTQLAAWSLVTPGGEDLYDLQALKAALQRLPQTAKRGDPEAGHGILSLLGEDTELRLADDFRLRAVRILFERGPAAEIDALVPLVVDAPHDGPMSYPHAMIRLCKDFGRDYDFKHLKPYVSPLLASSQEYRERSQRSYRRILAPWVKANASSESSTLDPARPAFELAGFLQASNLESEDWTWDSELPDASLATVLTAALHLMVLPSRLTLDQARAVLRAIDAAEADPDIWFHAGLPRVDHPPVDWSGAGALNLDPTLLEPALHFPADAMVVMAANLIRAQDPAIIQEIAERAYRDGRYLTLSAAVHLAAEVDLPRAIALTHERLQGPMTRGCEHLFANLVRLEAPYDCRLIEAWTTGLVASYSIAVAAARAAVYYAPMAGETLYPLLEHACDIWRTREIDQQTGPAVPFSARADLVKAMALIRPPDSEGWARLSCDPRSEIANWARAQVAELGGRDALP